MAERRNDDSHKDMPRQDDVDDKVFPAYPAGVGMAVPPQAVGIDPTAEADATRNRPAEPTEEDEWHMPDEDREKAIENARQRGQD